ncbi:MAG: DUF2066 domain-containing protein [Wenzhouxiangellaceae bacterium]|nr:DUF2066 domain-containing protein [Wenzhouxiangellaceae bacterium]
MNVPRLTLLLLAAAGWCQCAAAQLPLYVGEAVVAPAPATPATTDTAAGRTARAPILDALNQVLVRLTGQAGRDLVAALEIDAERAGQLALASQYRNVAVPGPDGGFVEQRRLRVDFDPEAVDRLVDQSEFSRWGHERPAFLVWIVTTDQGRAEYLEADPVIDYALEQAAFRYGIPLTRPILDANDRIEVAPADIRGGFTGEALEAMRRYGADGVIMLELRENPDFVTGRWAWRIANLENAFQRSGADRIEVVELGIGRIAGALAARFAVDPQAASARRLVVSGIRSDAHYTELLAYLRGLTGVSRVRPLHAEGDTMTFEIVSSTGGLRERIRLTGPLAFERHDLATGTLHYRLAW